jgi:fructose 1,6-bisphosphate aldolase/phosphatase
MVRRAQVVLNEEINEGLIHDGLVFHTGDDVCLVIVHVHGKLNERVHNLAWSIFKDLTKVAQESGLYGAGQDLLVDAPSGNVRGCGPGVAEIELSERSAEAFTIFAADKCGPGAYNLPLYQVFFDPMHNGGLLLNPKLREGFVVKVIDMDHTEGDRIIELNAPEDIWNVAVLLRDTDRYAIESIWSKHDQSQIVSVSSDRLHNISGVYSGKDDPVSIVRVQGAYPAPEEVVEPWTQGHYVTGGARGSHVMPIIPMAINSTVAGPYCLPVVTAITCSLNEKGKISWVDLFGDTVWDATREDIARKGVEFRRQGFFGVTMAGQAELAYTGMVDALAELDGRFEVR